MEKAPPPVVIIEDEDSQNKIEESLQSIFTEETVNKPVTRSAKKIKSKM